MRVIAVNRFYYPDNSATSQLLSDLGEYLAAAGEDVTVVASRMRYDDPSVRLAAKESANGVRIIRVWSSRFGRFHMIGRSVDYLTFYCSAFFALLNLVRRGDVVLAKTDPPLISVAGFLAAKLKGARLVNWCQDLFPEVAGALGMKWAEGPLGVFLRGVRNISVRHADCNVVLCEEMAAHLQAQGVSRDAVRIVENWCDGDIRPVARNANYKRREWGLCDKVVLAYSGNLGRAHAPSKVVELVRRTYDLPNVAWLFIGGGAGLSEVKALAADLDADNILFKPYQPLGELSESLSVGDLHLVSLDPPCEGLIMPSKLYGIRAAGRHAVFLGARCGSVARHIERVGHGVALDIESPENWRCKVEAFVEAVVGRPQEPLPDYVAAVQGARSKAAWAAVLSNCF